MKEILICVFYFTSLTFARTSPELEVNLTEGKILGRFKTSNSGRTIRAFMGIPFAEPPINDLRFRAPFKKKPWRPNTLVTQKEPNKCPQVNQHVFEGNEDCLYLNVYAPEVKFKEKYPVIVFFHGGSFLTGSGGISEHGPDYFLDTDVILVVGNYRLGALGFLSTEDEYSPGNYGLKDQVALLRWVNENIESFGGDINLITIFGESVGGSSVNFHMISPLSQNLFHRGISQSGTLQSFWADPLQNGIAKERAEKVAKSLNCSDIENSEVIMNCLRNQSTESLTNSIFTFGDMLEYTSPFLPVMENLTQTIEEPFITVETFKYNNIAKKIPWLVGINSEEGALVSSFLYSDDGVKLFEWTDKIPKYLGYDHLDEFDQEEITKEIREFYFNNEAITYAKFENITNLLTDGGGYFGMFDVLEARLKNNHLDNTFVYFYSHKGGASFTEVTGRQKFLGTSHMDELLNLFPLYESQQFYSSAPTDFDRALQKIMPNLWVNFARTGNPNLGHVNPFTHSDQFWKSAKNFPLDYMRIGNENGKSRRLLEMKNGLLTERVEFWRRLKSNYPIIQWKL
ncbi:hypothetical protein PVAND_006303 [Polypedilum vanderplanki]|uniref:Carboxylesterase type B domain-containing protein n=1 Tax=Polypedilum vanderplanki TaxID=319348 RepID=A0A9J6C382_POLVA|nr:hypothetical protein PVAND_006303 [Polypedilum vanderplanki]